jgi:hypothetical protein
MWRVAPVAYVAVRGQCLGHRLFGRVGVDPETAGHVVHRDPLHAVGPRCPFVGQFLDVRAKAVHKVGRLLVLGSFRFGHAGLYAGLTGVVTLQNPGPDSSAHASASARLAKSHRATSRDPQPEHLNGQSRSGRMLPSRLPSRSSGTSARRLHASHSIPSGLPWSWRCDRWRGR